MNSLDLAGRCAVVTGAASGIGLAVAQRLQESGAMVALWDLDPAACAKAAQSLAGSTPVAVDVSNQESVAKALDATLKAMPRIDILVNNAGVAGPSAMLWDYSEADWSKVFAVNVNGPFLCCKTIVPLMRDNGYGRIVNIASVAGKEGNPTASAYSASKAAVIAMTKSLGKELAGTEIRVNCVTPAAVRTPIFDQISQEHVDYMLSKIPLGRFGTTEEIAAMVGWLCTEECSFTTGGVFDLSGGRATY